MATSSTSVTEGPKPAVFKLDAEGLPLETVLRLYDEWDTYEDDLLAEDYIGHTETTKLAASFYPENTRRELKVIDVGAGSGLTGIELKKQGFGHVDALEPTNLAENAQKRGVYENYFKEYLEVDKPCSIKTNTYDCATATACFSVTHIPAEALEEVIRIVKPGGRIFVTVKNLKEIESIINVSKDLKNRGKLADVRTVYMPFYRKGHDGFMYVFTKQ